MFLYPTNNYVITPKKLSLEYRQLTIRDKNRPNLSAWLLLAKKPAKGLIVFAHGNAQNISNHLASVYWLPAAGYHVLTFDYRGYGKSKGGKSLRGAAKDVKRAILFANKLRSTLSPHKQLNISLYGQSIGASLAINAASDENLKPILSKVVAESGFANYRQIFREKASVFMLTALLAYPLSFSLPEELNPEYHVGLISLTPLLIIHGKNDFIVPFANGEYLQSLAKEPKTFWPIPSKGHLEIFTDKENREKLIRYLEK